MKIIRETRDQRAERMSKPVMKFAWFPTKMDDGVVIWLEYYWFAIYTMFPWRINFRTRSLTKEGLCESRKLKRPPAPKPTVKGGKA